MINVKIIELTPETISNYGVCGYKDVKKHVELQNKIKWYAKYYVKGLRIKALIANDGGYQGMIEYIPGEYAHRPVSAQGYMFIHCIFVGFKNEFKNKGFATSLISECINDAKKNNMNGVATVTRKGSFMAKKDIFLKMGFQLVDLAKPDFELMVLKFNENNQNPKFFNIEEQLQNYTKGLYIFRSPQCPYTEKNVNSIMESATKIFKLKPVLINLSSHSEAQKAPSPFGTFCIVYNGKVISDSPISNTRFENIMKSILNKDKL